MSSLSQPVDTMSPPHAKRQKLRKGTHSCWACKRRKMKCVFDPFDNTICKPCQIRGSKCVGQEFLEDVWTPDTRTGGGNIATDQGRTPLTSSEDGKRSSDGILTPTSTILTTSASLNFYQSPQQPSAEGRVFSNNFGKPEIEIRVSHNKHKRLSQLLHESLPPREDTERICQAGGDPVILAHEILTMPYDTLSKTALKTSETLLNVPNVNTHPVLIARYMLQLATVLQHLHPDLHEGIKSLSETPRATMERLANLVIDLVITRDEFLGSIEGLECIMIKSMYQANIGSLRRSWVSNRKAMGIARLMRLDRSDHRTQFEVLDPNTRCHPQIMWFRIVFLDRQLSLLLGLSQGSLDHSMTSDAMLQTDTPMGRLERIHCVLLSKILERNASSSHSMLQDYSTMKTLDLELQKAARGLPSKWWLVPTLNAGLTDSQALFWDTRRLFAQVLHYNLVNHLHLPYMLRSSLAGREYEFSRITCVNASREVLSRFITLRRFNRIAYSCRTIDFLALMAAMTLLLAHLDSQPEAENLLAHQYLSDRAMIEQAQENMQEVNSLNSDAMSAQSAELLRRLLAIGSGPLDGSRRISVQRLATETVSMDQNDDDVVTVNIPYFGIVKISGGGMRKEAPRNQYPQQQTDSTFNRLPQFQTVNMPCNTRPGNVHTADTLRHGGIAKPHKMPNVEAMKSPVDARLDRLEMPSMSPNPLTAAGTDGSASNRVPQINNMFSDPFFQNPGLIAGGQDWAFQGVDMAFFDNLMNNGGTGDTG